MENNNFIAKIIGFLSAILGFITAVINLIITLIISNRKASLNHEIVNDQLPKTSLPWSKVGIIVGIVLTCIGIIILIYTYRRVIKERFIKILASRSKLKIIIGIAIISTGIAILIIIYSLPEKYPDENFVFIHGNSFLWRGKLVRVEDFYILKHEVTTKEYLEFVKENSDESKIQPQWRNTKLKNDPYITKYYDGFTEGNQPIVGITWEQANLYCLWLSKKIGKNCYLPTELQWEYAARAGGHGEFGRGKNDEMVNSQNLHVYAWYRENIFLGEYPERTRPVMQKEVNAFGLFDIWGNAAEWTADDYKEDGKVYKGGSWEDPIKYCATQFRDGLRPNVPPKRTISFRIVCEP